MTKMTFAAAVSLTVRNELRRDPRFFAMGEDLGSGLYGDFGQHEFGHERVRSTPISEAGFLGAGMGAALTGMRPYVDLGASNFLYSAMDQLANQIAKSRYMFGGQGTIPIVVRATVVYGNSTAAHHSDRPWGLFAQIPGLKIVVPSNAYDAKGLLTSAIRDDSPVLWLEDANVAGRRVEVPEEDYLIPLGVADVKREGTDVTIVAIGASVGLALDAAARLEADGISAEVIDPRSIVPLDRDTIVASVIKTGRLVVVDPAPAMCGVAAEISAFAGEIAFDALKAPVARVTAPDVPVPFSPALEGLMFPSVDKIVAAVGTVMARTARGSEAARV